MSDELIGYVGPSDLHDGVIREIARHEDGTTVRVVSLAGREHRLVFRGVRAVRAHRADGMMLYALAELRSEGPVRHFTFVNWDEADDARLDIEAMELHVDPAQGNPGDAA
jgi:hypothetical protein